MADAAKEPEGAGRPVASGWQAKAYLYPTIVTANLNTRYAVGSVEGAMGKVVETIYGKYSKYEIVKSDGPAMGLLGNASFHIYRDGKYHRGSFSSLSAAVRAARGDG